jgi:hypothetical protein
MADRKKLPNIITPKGTFRFPKLNEADYGTKDYPNPDGSYSVQLVLQQDSPEAKAFLAALNPHYQAAIAEAKTKVKDLPVGPRKKLEKDNGKDGVKVNDLFTLIYDKETEKPTGEIFFKIGRKASGEYRKGPKAGERWTSKPLIFDAKGRRMDNPPPIWSGTVGKISVELSPYFVVGTGAAGLKMNLIGVQILDLVSGGGRSAEALGFGAEEGYEHQDSMFEEGAKPSQSASTNDDEGNF